MILKDGVWKHCFKEEELQTELHTRKEGDQEALSERWGTAFMGSWLGAKAQGF